MKMANILIFCDGGLGNRINALASGLALARYFGLSYCVHWPINNWCEAPFHKIFANRLNVSLKSISQLKGKLDGSVMLLHDEIASNALGVKFDSAYRYKNLQDFGELALQEDKTIFYYPAVIPNWVPEDLVHQEMRFLRFDSYIVREVKQFISKKLPSPFYGLHLRRTDLNVGLDDLEVFNLAKSNPEATFFVCSDDPRAERLAAGHFNVFNREKNFQIEKKTERADWLAQTHDDDGRLYYGNIQRNEDAVIEGAIDMLILAHSRIVGFSGSTFQKIARTLGSVAPLMNVERPIEIPVFFARDLEKLTNGQLVKLEYILEISKKLKEVNQPVAASKVLEKSLENFQDHEFSKICYQIGINELSNGLFKKSIIYLESAVKVNPQFQLAWLHLAFCYCKLSNFKLAKKSLNMYKLLNANSPSADENYLYNFLDNSINLIKD